MGCARGRLQAVHVHAAAWVRRRSAAPHAERGIWLSVGCLCHYGEHQGLIKGCRRTLHRCFVGRELVSDGHMAKQPGQLNFCSHWGHQEPTRVAKVKRIHDMATLITARQPQKAAPYLLPIADEAAWRQPPRQHRNGINLGCCHATIGDRMGRDRDRDRDRDRGRAAAGSDQSSPASQTTPAPREASGICSRLVDKEAEAEHISGVTRRCGCS